MNLLLRLIVFCALCEMANKSRAATYDWIGRAAGGNANLWSSKNNWQIGGVATPGAPTSSDDALFGTVSAGSITPTLTVNSSIQSILFSGDRAFDFEGNLTLTVNHTIENNSSADQVFSVATVALGADQTWNASSGNLTFNSALNNNGHSLILTDGSVARSTLLTGQISGSGSLTFSGSGTLVLSGANTYSGPTTVNSGILAAMTAGSFGSVASHTSGLNISGGAVSIGATPAATGIPLTLSGSGTLQANNQNSTWGVLTLAGGSPHLDLAPGDSGKTISFTGGLYTSGSLTIDHWSQAANHDQVLVNGAINEAFLVNVNFEGFGSGAQLVDNELIPLSVPEPQTFAYLVCFGIGFGIYSSYRRRSFTKPLSR